MAKKALVVCKLFKAGVMDFSGSHENVAAFIVLKAFQSCLSERHSNIPLHLIWPQSKSLYVTPSVMNTVQLRAGARPGCFSNQDVLHCCRLQAVYSPITVENFVTMYTGFVPCNRGNLLLRL